MVKRSLLQRARFILRILWMGCALVFLSVAASPALGQPSAEGDWVRPLNGTGDGYGWPLHTFDAALMSTGRVLVWDAVIADDTKPKLWNPKDGSFADVPPDNIDPMPGLHCGGWAHLSDGSLLVAGGAPGEATGPGFFEDKTTFFRISGPDPWEEGPLMDYKRWYPTCTTLPDGRILVVAGIGTNASLVEQPEIYNPTFNQWGTLGDLTTSEIAPLYPSMFVMPDGRVFYAGGGHNEHDNKTYVLDLDTPSWTEYPASSNSFFSGRLGSIVMYEPGKVLKTGGEDAHDDPINKVSRINLNDTSPQWELLTSAPLPVVPRKDHHLILLPDGKILLVGGHDGTNFIRDARMFDPQLQFPTWVDMADMVKDRGHHSVALLLPDATVLTAGGIDGESAEIFRPPYLYTGTPTPKIGYAPRRVGYNTQFNVTLAKGPLTTADIDKVTLIRPASVTHWLDQDQHFLSLSVTVQTPDTMRVTSPANANLAPPGYYMLFVVTDAGVPSVASWIQLKGP